ncbi:MAG TPA: hypothetical protein VIN08_26325 [Ohtaekwangia sp.]|uniref:hypothetical protein n=1 Tax=Ohtaekwangia sp. TaxID=2066019 RepID=UPI002F9563F4
MKVKKDNLFLTICFSLTLSVFAGSALAQPGNPQTGGDIDNPVPLTGLEYLAVSGGILGAYKLLRKRISKD